MNYYDDCRRRDEAGDGLGCLLALAQCFEDATSTTRAYRTPQMLELYDISKQGPFVSVPLWALGAFASRWYAYLGRQCQTLDAAFGVPANTKRDVYEQLVKRPAVERVRELVGSGVRVTEALQLVADETAIGRESLLKWYYADGATRFLMRIKAHNRKLQSKCSTTEGGQ